MKIFLLIAFALGSIIAANPPAPVYFGEEDGVITLNETNFAPAFEQFRYFFIHFYTPEFMSTNTFAKEYAKAAQEIKTLFPGAKLCKMDATAYKDYAATYEITEFPSIKFFVKGVSDPIEYDGGKKADDIVNWLRNKVEAIIIKPDSLGSMKKYIAEHEHVGVFFGSPSSANYSTFLAAITLSGNVTFMVTGLDSALKYYKVEDNSFMLFRSHDQERNLYPNPSDLDELVNWIKIGKYPAVMKAYKDISERIFKGKSDAMFLIRNKNEDSIPAEEAFTEVAQEYRDIFAFSVVYFEESLGSQVAAYMGIEGHDLPAVVILQSTNNNRKYRLDREIFDYEIAIFLHNFLQSNLKPYYKSAPIPAVSHDGHVRIAVAKNFKEIVLDNTKDVLIEFYSPTCKRCQDFAPIYKAIAEQFKDREDLVIVKIDASANEVEDLEIKGYPSLFFYPKMDKKSPVPYIGDLNEGDVLAFLNEGLKAKTGDAAF